jgi:hypothetical protein
LQRKAKLEKLGFQVRDISDDVYRRGWEAIDNKQCSNADENCESGTITICSSTEKTPVKPSVWTADSLDKYWNETERSYFSDEQWQVICDLEAKEYEELQRDMLRAENEMLRAELALVQWLIANKQELMSDLCKMQQVVERCVCYSAFRGIFAMFSKRINWIAPDSVGTPLIHRWLANLRIEPTKHALWSGPNGVWYPNDYAALKDKEQTAETLLHVYLFQQLDPNIACTKRGQTLIELATEIESVALVSILLAAGAKPPRNITNAQWHSNNTIAHLFSVCGYAPLPYNSLQCSVDFARKKMRLAFTEWYATQALRILCALQALDLPALVAMEIVDYSVVDEWPGNDLVKIHTRYQIVCAIKHFRKQRV